MAMEGLPSALREKMVGTATLKHRGKTWTYAIIKRDLENAPKGFLGFWEDKELFISEEVPEEFREYQLRHELIEHLELTGKPRRCVEALMQEIDLVPDEIADAYIAYRRNFFTRLVEYYSTPGNEHYDPDFLARITASRDYLNNLHGLMLEKDALDS